MKKAGIIWLAAVTALFVGGCGTKVEPDKNLIVNNNAKERVVNLFGPMEKSKPNAENAARNAFDRTIAIAEERLNLTVDYRTYTADDHTEKTYDDVVLDRARNDMDDLYLLDRKSVV